MAPSRKRNRGKKPVQYRGMPPGFEPGTGYVPLVPLTDEERNGKDVAEDDSSDEAPGEFESYAGCTKKGGPCLKRINTLKKPNLTAMSTWTTQEYADYDSYLIKKWEISGWCDSDSVYVGARDFQSRCAFAARTFYKFNRVVHGRTIDKPPQNTPLPDLSRMHLWTAMDYDLYDLSLINKWRNTGWDESDAAYASTRDKATLIYRTAQNMARTNIMQDRPIPVSKTATGKRKRND
ncbi:hypothetical protein N665_0514s0014 [Sinapis alba]|nr:hypothetical protein N665_0514s0014 [Sinapis alba]